MDFSQFIDIFLHLDKHLANVVEHYGVWVYALLFAIIFIETGAVVMPFLPGDSLLFVAGTLAGIGAMNLGVLMAVLSVAAILGDAVNYSIGRYFGPKVFSWESSRFFNKEAFNKTHDFYEKHGPITIIVARFSALRAHLCALCGRHGQDDLPALCALQHRRRTAVGGGSYPGWVT